MKKTIIYHGYQKQGSQPIDCPDGITAAALIYAHLIGAGSDAGSVQAVADWYLPSDSYESCTPPDLLELTAESSEIWIVDFSYPAHWLRQMEGQGCKVKVIDHHTDRLEKFQLANFSQAVYPSGEGEHCGATLVWEQLYPDIPLPKSLHWVRQRDIGLDGYYEGLVPGSEAFNLGLSELRSQWRQSLSQHDFLLRLKDFIVSPDQWREAIELGRPAVDERDKAIAGFLGATAHAVLRIGGEIFPVLPMPEHLARHHSVLTHRLLRRARRIDGVAYKFAVSVHPDGSLSARSDDWDIRDWANALGGGGHPKACGLAAGSEGAKQVAEVLSLSSANIQFRQLPSL